MKVCIKSVVLKILLVFLFSTGSSHAFAGDVAPCWLYNPVTESQMGFIGAANPLSVKINGSLIASRQRALLTLFDYFELPFSDEDINFNQNHLTLSNGKIVVFSKPYTDTQALYSYVSFVEDGHGKVKQQQWFRQRCPVPSCNFKQCSPDWLCSETTQDNLLLLDSKPSTNNRSINSVSQLTANPAAQLAKTKANAQALLKFIIQADVEDHSYQVKSTGQYQTWGYSEHRGQVIALGTNTKILNTHSCKTPSYLFARYIYPTENNVKNKTFKQWLRAPNIADITGVVGMFNGMVADGRFSSAIQYAIKDGLIELGKTKQITIEHDYQLNYSNGYYSLSKTTMNMAVIVRAQLLDIKIVEEDDRLIIYAWLLESNNG